MKKRYPKRPEKGTVEKVVDMLEGICGLKEEPAYSLGFQRLTKLSQRQRVLAHQRLYRQGIRNDSENHDALKRLLSNMSESEFQSWKKTFK